MSDNLTQLHCANKYLLDRQALDFQNQYLLRWAYSYTQGVERAYNVTD